MLSVAFAETVTVLFMAALAVGTVMETTGGVLSAAALFTVMDMDEAVVALPALSVAMAERACEPFATVVVSHKRE